MDTPRETLYVLRPHPRDRTEGIQGVHGGNNAFVFIVRWEPTNIQCTHKG